MFSNVEKLYVSDMQGYATPETNVSCCTLVFVALQVVKTFDVALVSNWELESELEKVRELE